MYLLGNAPTVRCLRPTHPGHAKEALPPPSRMHVHSERSAYGRTSDSNIRPSPQVGDNGSLTNRLAEQHLRLRDIAAVLVVRGVQVLLHENRLLMGNAPHEHAEHSLGDDVRD